MTVSSDPVEFMTKAKFSKLVNSVVKEKRMPYIDAVLHLCERYSIDPQDAKKYVSTVVKSKIEAEARVLNYLPKQNELPV